MLLISLVFRLVIRAPLESESFQTEEKKVTFIEAWKIPGVIEYTLSYACSKFVNYAWMFWLPYYLDVVLGFSPLIIGLVMVMYELGAILGASVGGWISDKLNTRVGTVYTMISLVSPLTIFIWNSENDMVVQIVVCVLMLGVSVAGSCYIMDSCFPADLASDSSQIATISGIMDGTGSLFAGTGIFFVGYLQQYSWDYVFSLIIAANLISILTVCIVKYKQVEKEKQKTTQITHI